MSETDIFNEKLLVKGLMFGEAKAFRKLFNTYKNDVYAFSMSMLKSKELAEEIVQDVLVSIWESRNKLKIAHAIRPYLYKSVHNRCLNFIRHQKVKQDHQSHEMALVDVKIESASERLELNELKNRVELGMQKLPPACREVFRLSRVEQLSYKEIADFLQISIKTVENQMGKALKIMRSELADFLILVLVFSSLSLFCDAWGYFTLSVSLI